MKKILVVFGTRPEAIKMAPVILELNKNKKDFMCAVCVTGQHREMLDQVLNFFEIKPDYDLNIMRQGQSLNEMAEKLLKGLCAIYQEFKPDLVLVHGDTTTTFVASLGAFYSQIQVGHVEAGLRTGNILSPFPEEFNRRAAALMASIHFAPTTKAMKNLEKEGILVNVYNTGNTVIDSLRLSLDIIKNNEFLKSKIENYLQSILSFDWRSDRYLVVTAHRRENFGSGLDSICCALKTLANINQDVKIIFPVHPNPNVIGPVRHHLAGIKNICLIPPLEYEYFLVLLQNCYFVLTDSGGIQEEAPSLGKPVLVMRSDTERPEGVEAGLVKLVGSTPEAIVKGCSDLLLDVKKYDAMSRGDNPYGDGKSAKKIVEKLKEFYK